MTNDSQPFQVIFEGIDGLDCIYDGDEMVALHAISFLAGTLQSGIDCILT